MSQVTDRSLYSALAQLPDARKARGKLYPLPALLTMTAAAILCGCRTLTAVAQWGRDYNHLLGLLGFTKRVGDRYRCPCVGELSTVYAALDADAFEAALRGWLQAGERGPSVAIDGKRLRGSRDGAVPGVHLVSAYDGDAKQVLAQVSAGDTNEAKAALVLLGLIPLGGVVVTGDAAFTQRDFCEQVIAGGGDYFLPVKDNQPELKQAIAAGFERAFSPEGAGGASGDR
jgi:DDE_Tnp_1-associated/Transposase DDE domain